MENWAIQNDGLGNNLHPVVYGIVVMVIFNLLMILMNAFINKQKKSSEIVESLVELNLNTNAL